MKSKNIMHFVNLPRLDCDSPYHRKHPEGSCKMLENSVVMQPPLVIKLSSTQIDSCCKCINSRLVWHKHFLSYTLFTTFFQNPVLTYHLHIHKHYSGINVAITEKPSAIIVRNSRNLYPIHILIIKVAEIFPAQHISIQIKNSFLNICLISKETQHTARSKSALHICLWQLLNKISCNINKKDIYLTVQFIQLSFHIFCKCFINRIVINTFFTVIHRKNIYI